MKILRDILIFGIVLGLIFVFLNISFSKKIKQQNFCAASDITSLKITKQGETPIIAQLITHGENMAWELNWGSLSDSANDPQLEALTRVLCHLPYVEEYPLSELTTSEQSLSSFGLDPPQYEITMGLKDQKEILLSFGLDAPSGTEFYFRSSTGDTSKVFTAANRLRKMIFPAFMDLRIRNPFYGLKEGSSLTLKVNGREYHFLKEGENLRETNNQMSPQDSKELLDILKIIHYKNYEGPYSTIDQMDTFGLDNPDVEIIVTPLGGASANYAFVLSGTRYYLSEIAGKDTYVLILHHDEPASLYEKLRHLSP